MPTVELDFSEGHAEMHPEYSFSAKYCMCPQLLQLHAAKGPHN